jgi:uncharacterized protein (TIGR04255 family)
MNENCLVKCPIVEASVDINCTYGIPVEAIVGVVYQILQGKGMKKLNIVSLPISNLPEVIRNGDPNLKNSPTHQITCEKGIVSIGSNVLSIGIIPPYNSWLIFKDFANLVIDAIIKGKLIKSVSNINIRYLNFFKFNIYDKINLNISLSGIEIVGKSTIFRTEIEKEKNIIDVIQITGSVHLKNKQLQLDNDGSLIDLRVVKRSISENDIESSLDEIHKEAETLFFGIISSDLKKELQS